MPKRPEIRNCRDLEVWRLGMDVPVKVYEVSKGFPAVPSIPSTSHAGSAATGGRIGPSQYF